MAGNQSWWEASGLGANEKPGVWKSLIGLANRMKKPVTVIVEMKSPDLSQPVKRLKEPYTYCEEFNTYRCEYCDKQDRWQFYKTAKAMENRINKHQVYD